MNAQLRSGRHLRSVNRLNVIGEVIDPHRGNIAYRVMLSSPDIDSANMNEKCNQDSGNHCRLCKLTTSISSMRCRSPAMSSIITLMQPLTADPGKLIVRTTQASPRHITRKRHF